MSGYPTGHALTSSPREQSWGASFPSERSRISVAQKRGERHEARLTEHCRLGHRFGGLRLGWGHSGGMAELELQFCLLKRPQVGGHTSLHLSLLEQGTEMGLPRT